MAILRKRADPDSPQSPAAGVVASGRASLGVSGEHDPGPFRGEERRDPDIRPLVAAGTRLGPRRLHMQRAVSDPWCKTGHAPIAQRQRDH